MTIRNYKYDDINKINFLGNNLHSNYEFKLDSFSNCIVCENNDDIIGIIIYSIIYERAEIIDIIVNGNYRRKGIGSKLLDKVINICNLKNCLNITLEVNENNSNAIKFYSNFNFTIISKRKNYYNNGNECAYVMEKKLR